MKELRFGEDPMESFGIASNAAAPSTSALIPQLLPR